MLNSLKLFSRSDPDKSAYELLQTGHHAATRPSSLRILGSKLVLRFFLLLLLLCFLAGATVHLLRRPSDAQAKAESPSPVDNAAQPVRENVAPVSSAQLDICRATRETMVSIAKQVTPGGKAVFQGTTLPALNLTVSLHPSLQDAWSCFTCKSRYMPFEKALKDINGNPNNCGNTQALVVRLEPDHQYTSDFNRHLAALVSEVAWQHDMDVRILQQFTNRDDWPDSRTPEMFRPLVTFFNADEVFRAFPQHRDHINEPSFNIDRHAGKYLTRYNQVVDVLFFNQFAHYEFAWVFNAKVRSTGPWSLQFDPLLAAIAELGKQPDLVTFDPIISSPAKANWKTLETWRPEHYVTSNIMIHGISRRMARAMSDYLAEGFNAIAEAFIPAVALKHQVFRVLVWPHTHARKTAMNLGFSKWVPPKDSKIQLLGMPNAAAWEYGYSCTGGRETSWANELYQRWVEGDMCLPALLIHPVSGL